MIGSDRFNSHKWSRVSDEAASDGCLLSTAHVSMSIQGKCERVFFLLDENGEFLAVFFSMKTDGFVDTDRLTLESTSGQQIESKNDCLQE